MTHLLVLFLFAGPGAFHPPYTCGQSEIRIMPYGIVDRSVDCDGLEDYNSISVLEYKKGTHLQHGVTIHFDGKWRRLDSSFFVNGKKNGVLIFWDTLGNVVGRRTFRHGIQVGKDENYWSPGRPSLIKNYNARGEEDGPWEEWWKNGNKKAEFIAKKGHIISGKEYYQDGTPRVQYATKDEPRKKNYLETKYIQAESWSPNGKPAGRITKGDGEWTVFPDGRDSANHAVFREVYKDSLLVKVTNLDSTEVARWMAP